MRRLVTSDFVYVAAQQQNLLLVQFVKCENRETLANDEN
jgi:hypothetical protein